MDQTTFFIIMAVVATLLIMGVVLGMRRLKYLFLNPTRVALQEIFEALSTLNRLTMQQVDDQHWVIRTQLQGVRFNMYYRSVLTRGTWNDRDKKLSMEHVDVLLPGIEAEQAEVYREEIALLTEKFGGRVKILNGRIRWEVPFNQPGERIEHVLAEIARLCPENLRTYAGQFETTE